MNISVELPDLLAARFRSEAELGRHVLELLALDEYRLGRLSRAELRETLGFGTRSELDAFLNDRGVPEGITMEEFEQDLRDMERAGF